MLAEALATVQYRGKPTHHAIILARSAPHIEHFPEDARGMSISCADAGSTGGWLVSHHWCQTRGIDPRTFKHRDGASHAADVVAVASGRVDLATGYDRALAAMIAAGRVREDRMRVVWRSGLGPSGGVLLPAERGRWGVPLAPAPVPW